MRLASLSVPNVATTTTVSVSGTSAQSVVLSGADVVVLPTIDCFVIRGKNPTATTACLPLLANVHWRLTGIQPDEKLAFITSGGTGTVYVSDNC